MKIFSAQRSTLFSWPEQCVLVLYSILAIVLALRHVSWSDEAQAWLIAHDCPLGQILFVRMHYEGTPGLWHLLLWMLARMGLPYTAMHALSIAAGIGAAYLLLRFAPFPRPVRWLLPFTFALLFQTAVVARSYSLVPLLVFALCLTQSSARPRPLLFALLAGLLANTALIAFCLAAGMVAAYVLHLRELSDRPAAKQLFRAGALFVLLGAFAIYTAIPAPDQDTGEAHSLLANRSMGHMIALLTGIPQSAQIACKKPLLFPAAVRLHSARGYRYRLGLWLQPDTGHPSAMAKLAMSLFTWLSLLFYPVSSLNLLALAFYAALFVWLATHRHWSAALPLVFILIGAKFLPFSEHHSSVLWCGLIATLWLAAAHARSHPHARLNPIFFILLSLTLAEQIGWTAKAALARPAFDGARAAEDFLASLPPGKKIAGFDYHIASVMAYAPRTPFFNTNYRYWTWKSDTDADGHLDGILATRPDYIMTGESYYGNVAWRNQIAPTKPEGTLLSITPVAPYLRMHGYRETRRFCGDQPAQFGYSERDCQVLYQPAP